MHALILHGGEQKLRLLVEKRKVRVQLYKLQEAESQASLLESCLKSLCTVGLLLGYSPGTMACLQNGKGVKRNQKEAVRYDTSAMLVSHTI